MLNALTVDVEDYFHVAAFSKQIDPATWGSFTLRVERNTHRLLELFAEYDVRATFFVLGWVAERCPNLVREIEKQGHEIACHGYSHQLIYNQSPVVFREETIRAKACLEQQAQCEILGYRAASYSITKKSLWALHILTELGFKYDSSIFPVRHDRYGLLGSPRWPHELSTLSGNKLIEFPPTTLKIRDFVVPIGGGGYFRIYPYWFTERALLYINRSEKYPFLFYMHPWEIDPHQPRIKASWLSTFRHYKNLEYFENRLRRLLKKFKFVSSRIVLTELNLLTLS